MGSYIGFYSPPIGLSEKPMGVWLHVGVHDSLQSLNEPRIGECLVRPWSSLVYDISLPMQRSAER